MKIKLNDLMGGTEMRVAVKETMVYDYNELSDEAKRHALETLHNINIHDQWFDFVFDDVKAIAELMGIDIDNIYFSGFWSKGNGACFEGHYEYRRGSVQDVQQYAPQDKELHRIVKELAELQKVCFYQARAAIKHSGHYYHQYCTDISLDYESHDSGKDHYPGEHVEETIIGTLRDFMLWIYRHLEKNYEDLTSEESIIETIKANEYEFTEAGEIY